jgi:hypothetical protein
MKMVTDTLLQQIVAQGGGQWVGLQDTFLPDREPLVLFNSPTSKTTLALPVGLMTVDNVRGKIQGADAEFRKRPVKVERRKLESLLESAQNLANDITILLRGE